MNIVLLFLAGLVHAAEIDLDFAFQDTSGDVYLSDVGINPFEIGKICGRDLAQCSCDLKLKNGKSKRVPAPFEPSGFYFSCAAQESVSQVRLRRKNRVLSDWFKPVNRVGIAEVLGNSLSQRYLRSVFRYDCQHTFLQKTGTSEGIFDCSDQREACDRQGKGNFCTLTAQSSFYLFSSDVSSNNDLKEADQLYNAAGDSKLCGLQIPQIQCTGNLGRPRLEFGLYAEKAGPWIVSVEMAPGPRNPPQNMGYAQVPDPKTGNCPPWLEKRVKAEALIGKDQVPLDSNFPSRFRSKITVRADSVLEQIAVWQKGGGRCDGRNCTRPSELIAPVAASAYEEIPESAFCVIPAALLP